MLGNLRLSGGQGPGSLQVIILWQKGTTVQVGPSCPVLARPCVLTTRADPYLQLGPLRRELVCRAPRLELYHNLVGEREAALLAPGQEMQVYNEGEGLLTVVQAGTTAGTEAGQISGRSQAVGWRRDGERAGLARLAARTGRAVGLQVAEGGSELWQLGLYSPGGHFLPHWDAFKPDLLKASLPLREFWSLILLQDNVTEEGRWVGNRLATVMFYLTDLQGGRTAFPSLGVSVQPRAGSAVFWYNLQRGTGVR